MKKNGYHLVCVKYWSNYLKYTLHEFLDPQLPRNDKLYYVDDKTILFFINEKYGGHLGCMGEIGVIYTKYIRN